MSNPPPLRPPRHLDGDWLFSDPMKVAESRAAEPDPEDFAASALRHTARPGSDARFALLAGVVLVCLLVALAVERERTARHSQAVVASVCERPSPLPANVAPSAAKRT
jgi:hypothetical protein